MKIGAPASADRQILVATLLWASLNQLPVVAVPLIMGYAWVAL